MAVARASAHSGGGTAAASITVASIPGGADQAYVAFVDVRAGTDTITSITGGGLTWTLQGSQPAGRGNHTQRCYTAVGTPSSDPFTLTVNFSDATGTRSAVVGRYTGADVAGTPFELYKGRNTNGDSGAGTGGTDTATADITLVPTQDGSVIVNGASARTTTVSAADADYSQAANADYGAGGERLNLYLFDRALATAASDTISHTLGVVVDWSMQGIVVRPAPAGLVGSIGQASESDTPQAMARTKARPIAQAVEADLARPLSPAKARPVGIALESDAAQPLARARARTLGIAQESEIVQPLSAARVRAIGQLLEVDLPLAPSRAKARTIGPVLELDSPLTLARARSRVLSLATESDAPLALVLGDEEAIGTRLPVALYQRKAS